jgi:hypothetical protein
MAGTFSQTDLIADGIEFASEHHLDEDVLRPSGRGIGIGQPVINDYP